MASQRLKLDGRAEIEYRLITPTGDIKWLRDRAWLVAEQPDRVDGIITDITKRKVAEQAYRDSEERYRTAIKSSVEAIYMMNPATLIISDANDAFCDLLGYTHEEVVGLDITTFVMHERGDIVEYIQTVIDSGSSLLGERTWKNKAGELIDVEVTASSISQRDETIIFVVARDVTAEKLIYDELQKERSLLSEVVANAPIPMAMLDKDLRFILNSRAWQQTYGPIRTKLPGKKLFSLYPNMPEEWELMCQRGLEGEILHIPEQEVQINEKDKIYLRLAIHPWGKRDDDNYGIVLVAERIDELVNARKLAEEASLAKSAFLARITHELRTPLNAILGYSQIMMKDETVNKTHHGYIDNMYRSGNHLLNMINDILDLSKIEAARMELQNEAVDLKEVVRDITDMFRLKADGKGIDLRVEFDDDIHPFVQIDRSKFNQVLINLVGNAVKFTEIGHVLIQFHRMQAENEDEQHLYVAVQDTGRGIPKDELISVFEPFHQASNSDIKGTGLGLAITRRIVNLMGGDVEVESTLNEGSVFSFIVPLKLVDQSPVQKREAYAHVNRILSPQNFNVLVVDDVELNRTVVRLLLERIGAQVSEAKNGLESVEMFAAEPFNVVIMDIIMPVMDGVKAMNRIRSMETGKKVPIIALTASGFDDKRQQLLDAGFTDYILKPFRESELLGSIASHTDVVFEVKEEPKKVDDDVEQGEMGQVMECIDRLSNENRLELTEMLEFQDFDGIIRLLEKPQVGNEAPNLKKSLLKAINESDFYFVTQLAKLINNKYK
ncbi:MAG: PAS domain S-box protein [Balneolales bacterium]|nr:PAS domain S-box protein [Balneolales bacterium]